MYVTVKNLSLVWGLGCVVRSLGCVVRSLGRRVCSMGCVATSDFQG